MWDVKNDGVKVSAFSNTSSLEMLKKAAEQSGMTISVEKEKGLKTFIIQHKWRCGAIIGASFICLFLSFMSNFIWEIEIVCEDSVKEKAFAEELAEFGIKKGAKKDDIDIVEVKRQLLEKHREYAWVSINIFGGKLRAQMQSADENADILYHDSPYNILARKNGRITLVKGYYGQNLVKEGDYVAEGSLLISGISQYSDGTEHKFHAKGEVLAETLTKLKAEQAMSFKGQITASSDADYYLYFFEAQLPLGLKNKEKIKARSYAFLESRNGDLPLGIVREDGFSAEAASIALSENQALLLSLLQCIREKRNEFSEAQFISQSVTGDGKNDKYRITAEIKCIEDIAKEQLIETE